MKKKKKYETLTVAYQIPTGFKFKDVKIANGYALVNFQGKEIEEWQIRSMNWKVNFDGSAT